MQKTSRFIFVNLKLKHAHICCYDAHGNYNVPVLECEMKTVIMTDILWQTTQHFTTSLFSYTLSTTA